MLVTMAKHIARMVTAISEFFQSEMPMPMLISATKVNPTIMSNLRGNLGTMNIARNWAAGSKKEIRFRVFLAFS